MALPKRKFVLLLRFETNQIELNLNRTKSTSKHQSSKTRARAEIQHQLFEWFVSLVHLWHTCLRITTALFWLQTVQFERNKCKSRALRPKQGAKNFYFRHNSKNFSIAHVILVTWRKYKEEREGEKVRQVTVTSNKVGPFNLSSARSFDCRVGIKTLRSRCKLLLFLKNGRLSIWPANGLPFIVFHRRPFHLRLMVGFLNGEIKSPPVQVAWLPLNHVEF